VIAQRGSPSSRHKGRSSRWSADRRKQKTRRMTPMFCPLPYPETSVAGKTGRMTCVMRCSVQCVRRSKTSGKDQHCANKRAGQDWSELALRLLRCGGQDSGGHEGSPPVTPDGIRVAPSLGRSPGSRINTVLRLPGHWPSGTMKDRYRIQSRGRLRPWAPQLGPPFLIPD